MNRFRLKEIIREVLNENLEDFYVRQWVDYSEIKHPVNYSSPLALYMRNELKEGLIHTYPVDKTVDYIRNYFKLDVNQIKKVPSENGVYYIIVEIPTISDNLEQVIKAMNLCGYYLSYPKFDSVPKNKWVTLQFEPKFQEDDTEKIKANTDKLIHLTPSYNLDKIKKIGFTPKTKNGLFDFPDRVYFLTDGTDVNSLINIAKNLKDYKSNSDFIKSFSVIFVDVDLIPDKIKLYLDPNYIFGVYTYDNIPADTISEIEEITF